jgi:predicted signal transduction protein with EAL and GGDEF domain
MMDKTTQDGILESAGEGIYGLDLEGTTTVTLARQLGFRVIAEGVETIQQLEALVGLGSVVVQGLLSGRPERAANAKRHLQMVRPAKCS